MIVSELFRKKIKCKTYVLSFGYKTEVIAAALFDASTAPS